MEQGLVTPEVREHFEFPPAVATGSPKGPPEQELLDGRRAFLSTLPGGRGERRLALAVVLVSVAIFLSAVPFAKVPLAQVWAFIPIYESALVINDLITAVLLFGQFNFVRSRALLVLASGYLFTACMTVSHALTFPGLFSPTGLLGAGPQSTAWLYMFWHAGFPLLVIAYALLKDEGRETRRPASHASIAVVSSVACVLVVGSGLTLLATAGHASLPAILQGNHYTPAMMLVRSSTWGLSLLALGILWWRRPHAVLDLWLMVVMSAWLFDIALAAVFNAGRFDLGFYAGRIYGLLAASLVLMVLLIENGKFYARLVQAHEGERRERQRGQERTTELAAVNAELATEVTERRRAEAEAGAANRAKSEFLSRMSHELRTPLNAILGFGQLLEMRLETPNDQECLAQMMKGGRHLLGLINEILDIAAIEAGRLNLSPEPVEIGSAITAVFDLGRPLADERGIEFQMDGTEWHGQHVRADNQRLRQVLLNLVSNGIKYNCQGGRLTVTCRAARANRLRISVTDTGPGIPAAMQHRLFRPFERLDGDHVTQVEGTGLGLALSKGLVEAMGGQIGVDSTPGAGSTFWVELQRVDSPVEHQTRIERAGPLTAPQADWRGTVLYIEDNLSNLRLLEHLIEQRPGIKLIPAMQGRMGLEVARQHRPDVILLDLHLPDLSGEEVLGELKNDPALRHIPVIVVTADATRGKAERLLAAGAQTYLTKPLNVREVLRHVDELVARGDR